jgi:hypothetical protein
MKLPNFRRIYKTDYKEEFQDLVEQLSVTLNNGFESLYNALSGNLSLKDNISCTLKSIQVTVDANGTPNPAVTIALDKKTAVQGLSVLKIDNLTNATSYTAGGVTVNFSITDSGVKFDNIRGLIPLNNYQMKVVIFQD